MGSGQSRGGRRAGVRTQMCRGAARGVWSWAGEVTEPKSAWLCRTLTSSESSGLPSESCQKVADPMGRPLWGRAASGRGGE